MLKYQERKEEGGKTNSGSVGRHDNCWAEREDDVTNRTEEENKQSATLAPDDGTKKKNLVCNSHITSRRFSLGILDVLGGNWGNHAWGEHQKQDDSK